MKRRARGFPDGSVVVRTFPVTFLHDVTQSRHEKGWHTFIYAVEGNLEVHTGGVRRLVPSDRAVWIPAGTQCTTTMRAPITMRSLFFAPGVLRKSPELRTVIVAPLLRELIQEVTRLGALDRESPRHRRLLGVLLDTIHEAPEAKLEVPTPIDPRARRFAEAVLADPSDTRPVGKIARSVGASVRTLERCFITETGLTLGQWRRRVRLFHAMDRLERGASATEAALEAGYQSPSAFSQAFLRQFGRTPTGRRRR
ncbi:MAG: AraC family transcriptional regulator [Archangium sp.]